MKAGPGLTMNPIHRPRLGPGRAGYGRSLPHHADVREHGAAEGRGADLPHGAGAHRRIPECLRRRVRRTSGAHVRDAPGFVAGLRVSFLQPGAWRSVLCRQRRLRQDHRHDPAIWICRGLPSVPARRQYGGTHRRFEISSKLLVILRATDEEAGQSKLRDELLCRQDASAKCRFSCPKCHLTGPSLVPGDRFGAGKTKSSVKASVSHAEVVRA